MRLPAEIRNEIYLLATKDHIRPYVPARRGWWSEETEGSNTATLRSLRLVSKQVSGEATAEVLRVKPLVLYGSPQLLKIVREPFFETSIAPFISHLYIQVNRNDLADILRLDPARVTCEKASDEHPLGFSDGEKNRQEIAAALSKLLHLKSCRIFFAELDTPGNAISTRRMAERLWPAVQRKVAENPLQLKMKNQCARRVAIHRREFIGLRGPYPASMAPLREGETYIVPFR